MENKPTYEELQAQVEALRDAGNEVYAELQQWALSESHEETSRVFKLWLDTRAATPQHHLAELRAEAGRDWYVAGFKRRTALGPLRKMWSDEEIIELANQYAEQIRKGGAE